MSDSILVATKDRGLHITLTDPKGMSDDAARELTAILLGAHEKASYVVLRSNHADFCTGRNAPRPPAGAPLPDALTRRRAYEVIFNLYGSFRSCTVPIIGVVHGRALGLGCSLSALCDITLAADSAVFQVNEMNHRILPTMVMSSLVDRVPSKAMSYLVLSRDIITAERAMNMNIVSKVVPADHLENTLAELVATFESTPTLAMQAVKEYVNAAYDMPVKGAVDFARNIHAVINSSPEMRAEPPT